MLKHRLISGPILIVVFLGLVWLDEWVGLRTGLRGIVLLVLAAAAAGVAGVELAGVFEKKAILARRWLVGSAAVLGVIAMYLATISGLEALSSAFQAMIVPLGGAVVFGLGMWIYSRGRNTQGVIMATAGLLFAFTYIGVMLGFYFAIRQEHSAWWIVGIILTVKMCDSGAYFTGRAFGRRKLIPWLSPGKTWEGLFGGVATAALFGLLGAWLSGFLADPADHLPLWTGAACGVIFGLVGQAGDLCMSMAKRDAGLKDSGTILPGLGGVLDVLDSLILVAPVAFVLLAAVA